MKYSHVFGAFALICFIFALIYSKDVGEYQAKALPGSGGIFGPVEVKEKDSSYEISIHNYVSLNKWSSIEVAVLDENKQYLYSFSDDMWHESGVDSDGSWVESKTKYTMDVTFKDPGTYYLDVGAERNDGAGQQITVGIVKERGSNLAFKVLFVISLILVFITHYFSGLFESKPKQERNPDGTYKKGKRKIPYILITVLVLFFIWALVYSNKGWGYMGYNGYSHGPSFFYFGSPNVFHQPSNRDGSVSGSGNRGGGFSGGK